MSTPADSFPWRSLALSALLPTLLFSIGEGAIMPIIPIVARDLGSPLALAGLVAALLLVGEVLGDIPSGIVVARFGERPTMMGAAALSVAGTVVALLAPNPGVLAIGVFITGVTSASFALARHALLTSVVPPAYRARALSTLGGTFRAGMLVGPFLTAGLIELTHVTRLAFLIHIALCLAAAIILLVLPDPEELFGLPARGPRPGEEEVEEEARGLLPTLRANAGVLGTVGLGAAVLSALRASRQVILPLWAVSIGMGETAISVVVGIAGAVDFALFYLGGSLMDRFGRIWVVIPTTVALAVSHLLLAGTALLPHREWWFVGLAMVFALSNGLGSGILMTLGADLAPRRSPAQFLGAWRFTNDAGAAIAPLVLSGVTALASLPIASVVVGGVGLAGAVLLRTTLPRALARRPAGESPA